MKAPEVLQLLETHQNPRGMANWVKLFGGLGRFKSFGIGLTQLRRLAKKVGRDHDLAAELWTSDYVDARIISLLIDEPKKMTREQAEKQVEELGQGMLAHIFSSCDATLPKAAFAVELAGDWIRSKSQVRRQCGYGLIYELSKNTRDKRLTDDLFLECIERIRKSIAQEPDGVRIAMASALMGIGKRNKALHGPALALARELGPVQYDPGETSCAPIDVAKHLSSNALLKKFS